MANILDTVNQRTRLVGQNRLELLTFRLNGKQLYAINVFKVQEVMQLPKLNMLPNSDPTIAGITHVRDKTVAVVDLSQAIGRRPILNKEKSSIIITEYNRSVQAFLVGSVDRIINMNWDQIQPPPAAMGHKHYLTAITQMDGELIAIIDVEKVLAQLVHFRTTVSDGIMDSDLLTLAPDMEILLVDDSPIAIEQARSTLAHFNIKVHVETDGLKACRRLKQWADEGIDVPSKLLMVITDAEMPEMDGYRLTTEIRQDPRLRDLHVVLHTSLSGSFNKAMVEKVGCDDFLSKFQPDQLALLVQERIRAHIENKTP